MRILAKLIAAPFIALLALGACAGESAAPAQACCAATITAIVPDGTGTVYVTGNLDSLGPWKADAMLMEGDGRARVAKIRAPKGTALEYKFTLGAWEREALGPSGMVMANYRLTVDADVEARHEITDFKKETKEYIADWQGSGVKGTLVYRTDVGSEFLAEKRHVEIWLPPGYEENPDRRYKVLYMSDGQNLFDPRIANTGVDWGVDEAIVDLVEAGVIEPLIVVGVWSSSRRGEEYSPWHGAENYARFLIEELSPRVNTEFRTLTGPQNTAHMGSSMGGLLSFYLATRHPEFVGACGCVSTHFPLSEEIAAKYFPGAPAPENPDPEPYILKDLRTGLAVPARARLWFDYGSEGLDADYGPTHDAVRDWLAMQKLAEGEDYVIRRYEGADHNETSWRARLKDPLTFLYGGR